MMILRLWEGGRASGDSVWARLDCEDATTQRSHLVRACVPVALMPACLLLRARVAC